MKQKNLSLFICTLVALVLLASPYILTNGEKIRSPGAKSLLTNTLYVGGSGPNNYTQIQDAIDNASDNYTIFVYNGTYYENIVINKPLTLLGEHNSATIIDANGYGDVIEISTQNCTINGLTLTNSGVSDGGHINCGIYCNKNSPVITNNIIIGNNNGIGCWNGASPVIKENIIKNSTYDGIYAYSSSPVIENNSFIGNGASGITVRMDVTSTIIGNSITNNVKGVNCNYITGSSVLIEDNQIFENQYGILSSGSSNVTIRNNTIFNNSEDGIEFTDSFNNSIDHNIIFNNSVHGIDLSISSKNVIDNNLISNNSDKSIDLSGKSNNNTISRNILTYSHVGLHLSSSRHNTLINNTIISNQLGIRLFYSSNNNTLKKNNLMSNNMGLYLYDSTIGNLITENTISASASSGIYIQKSSHNNSIFHNNFINNNLHAKDDSINSWDDGYPSGGNYWDDYMGIDADGDGIYDIPYNITGGDNQDRYPLMNPWNFISSTEPVHNINKDTYYDVIQDAIDDGNSGDTIIVSSGVYYENLVINKPISLVGEDKNTTIIDGNGTGDVIYVSADWVNITQFKIQNSGGIFPNAGINIHSNYSTLHHNQIVENNNIGIHLIDSSNNTISDNNFTNNDVGLSVRYSQDNVIINNTFISNVWDGFSFTDSCDNIFSNNLFFNDGISLSYSSSTIIAKNYNNTISNNTVNEKPLIYLSGESNSIIIAEAGQLVLIGCDNITLQHQTLSNTTVGLQLIDTTNCLIKGVNIRDNRYGIRSLYSHNNIFLDNNISHNIAGIYVYRGTDNIILVNNISHTNGRGVFLHFSSNNTIINNTLFYNNEGITLYSSSDDNILYHNSMINNTLQAYDECSNTMWDNGYPSGGNHWSDFDEPHEGAYDNYTGPNQDIAGSDGIVDGGSLNPYYIIGGANTDRYPLIPQWNTTINTPPTCSLYGNPTSGYAPLTVTFTMTASDPDGAIATWTLDINNDGTSEYSGSGAPPTAQQHTYPTAGTYTAKFVVTDDDGAMDSDTQTITVNQEPIQNQAPTCTLSANPASGIVPLMVTFTLSGSDSDGTIATWTLDINNDGTSEYSGSGLPPSTQQHTYPTAGTYTAKFVVTDDDGAMDSDTRTITVNQELPQNETPIANFEVSKENLTVTFQDTSTDSDGYLTNWHWDFGDSNYSDLKNPVHTYEDEGSYTVTLTVTDNDNMTNSYTLTITVEKKQGEKNGGIPGFELAPLILLIISLLIIKQRKRNM